MSFGRRIYISSGVGMGRRWRRRKEKTRKRYAKNKDTRRAHLIVHINTCHPSKESPACVIVVVRKTF
jgi:hypothetical protein